MHKRWLGVRNILILVAFLLVVVVAWPIYVGYQVETALSQVRTVWLGEVRLQHTVRHYERENFQARVVSELHVQAEDVDFFLELEHHIQHRMLGVSIRSRLLNGLHPPSYAPLLNEWLAQAMPRAESWVGLGGGVSSRFFTQPARVTLPRGRGGFLDVGYGQGGVTYSQERIVVSFDTRSLTLANSGWNLVLRRPALGVLVHPVATGELGHLPDYDINLGAENIRLTESEQAVLLARSLQMTAWQNSTGHHLDSLLRLRSEDVMLLDLSIEKLETHISALGWYRPALVQAVKDWEHRAKQVPPVRMRPQQVTALFLETLAEMVAYQPRLQGELRLYNEPEQRLRLTLDAALTGDPNRFMERPLDGLDLQADLEWGGALVATVMAAWSEALGLDEYDQAAVQTWLDEALEAGWYDFEGGRYRSHAALQQGRLFLNGEDRSDLLVAAFLSALKNQP